MAGKGITFKVFTEMVNDKLAMHNVYGEGKTYMQSKIPCIWNQANTNGNEVLEQDEQPGAWEAFNIYLKDAKKINNANNSPKNNISQQQKPQIEDPNFRGLEDYNFMKHGAKEGFGQITVNGEKVLVTVYENNKYQIFRGHLTDGVIDGIEDLEFSSMEELKAALQDKKLNWGRSDSADMNDYFIP